MKKDNNKQKLRRIIAKYPVLNNLIECRGQFVGVKWRKKLQNYKDKEGEVIKEGTFNCRAGINHDERRDVIIARALGDLPIENVGLIPGMNWEVFPYFIKTSSGKLLCRLYPFGNSVPHYKYYLNGVEIDEETAKTFCVAKEFSNHNPKIGCVNLTADYIQEIHFKNE